MIVCLTENKKSSGPTTESRKGLRMLLKTIIPILIVLILTITNPKILSDPPPILEPEPVPVVADTPQESPKPVKTLVCEATAYCERGITAYGWQAGPGCIAVDPSVIPLGSFLWVEGYGLGWAVDTGSAIRGYIVDVWLPDRQTCLEWGRKKNVEVQVLEVPE